MGAGDGVGSACCASNGYAIAVPLVRKPRAIGIGRKSDIGAGTDGFVLRLGSDDGRRLKGVELCQFRCA